MGRISFTQAAGIAGIAVGALFFASGLFLPLNDLPESESGAVPVADFVLEHRGDVLVFVWMNSLGAGLFGLLLAGLRERLGDPWSRAGLATGLIATAIFATGFAGLVAAAYGVKTADPRTVQMMVDFAWATFAVSSISVAVSLGCFAASIFDTGRLPRWLGAGSLVVAALHVIAATAYKKTSGALSLEGEWAMYVPVAVYLWAVVVGVLLLRSTSPGAPASGSAPST